MLYISTIVSIIEILLITVPALLTVAFVTIAERKTMASMQRRLGPNIVGYYGLLQAFADALKLLVKECVLLIKANIPKSHAFVSLPLHSGKDFITIFIAGLFVTIPSSYISVVKNFGFYALFGFPIFTNIIVNVMAGDILEEDPLLPILTELNRLLPQLNLWVDQFHSFINETGINVVTDSEGRLGIDVASALDDSLAQQYANRINILDSLIHNNIHSIEGLLERGLEIENQIRVSNTSYVSRLWESGDRLRQLTHSYGHYVTE